MLDEIAEKDRFIEAWSDEPWVIDGAAVRVSIVCFGNRETAEGLQLNGAAVEQIHADLTIGANLTNAQRLAENAEVCFEGGQKYGDFDVSPETAEGWLKAPFNPNGRSNSDVLRPYMNANDLVRRSASRWIIDFGDRLADLKRKPALYEAPFQHVHEHVLPARREMPKVDRVTGGDMVGFEKDLMFALRS